MSDDYNPMDKRMDVGRQMKGYERIEFLVDTILSLLDPKECREIVTEVGEQNQVGDEAMQSVVEALDEHCQINVMTIMLARMAIRLRIHPQPVIDVTFSILCHEYGKETAQQWLAKHAAEGKMVDELKKEIQRRIDEFES